MRSASFAECDIGGGVDISAGLEGTTGAADAIKGRVSAGEEGRSGSALLRVGCGPDRVRFAGA